MSKYTISTISDELNEELTLKINNKTKPVGSLGKLETIAYKIGRIQQTVNPKLIQPTIAVFAGDHGIAKEGLVNPYPQEVTFQMVMNFISGGAAINVFANQNKISLKIIDAGVNYNFGNIEGLIDSKIDMGTSNYLQTKAMTTEQCEEGLKKGAQIVEEIYQEGCNVIGFGEMGIGNSSSAALLMSIICNIPIDDCVGNGTGVNEEQFQLKLKTLQQAIEKHSSLNQNDPFETLSTFGGFEIAQMCGGMLKAAQLGMLILVDGFISSAAILVAFQMNKQILDYALFTHHSNEQGHTKMLAYMNASPIINMDMRLGEGSGIAVAYPIIKAACTFLNEMASFDTAEVSNKV
ncbi:MAG: nicotinate-nucleotide--dimethylbenzimidazole phosphoribosyltransferase [Flavobacteriia bacterium]|nr:nicotinate-nucleotide--dimethylbenzimidazole phosphoribosyltransferase [Flavobacteriia bacterium]